MLGHLSPVPVHMLKLHTSVFKIWKKGLINIKARKHIFAIVIIKKNRKKEQGWNIFVNMNMMKTVWKNKYLVFLHNFWDSHTWWNCTHQWLRCEKKGLKNIKARKHTFAIVIIKKKTEKSTMMEYFCQHDYDENCLRGKRLHYYHYCIMSLNFQCTSSLWNFAGPYVSPIG